MTPKDHEAPEVDVLKTEKIETIRQAIRIPEQIEIPRILGAMLDVMRKGKYGGHFTVFLSNGGVKGIVTEQIIRETVEE
jgi:hypothetical protein